jgi:O-antigen ligase
LLAIATEWGFDPLDSMSITNGSMKGRLVLNLSIFDNPNGLGHSVVPAIPMLYYYLIWKRPITSRALGVGFLLIPLYCIYLTVSKGSFLCGGITIFATMAIGRPLRVQVAMAVFAAMFGTGMLFALPRMNELSKSKSDPAIQGRVLAFKHGYELLQTRIAGVGKGHWGDDAFITEYTPLLLSPKPGEAYAKPRIVLRPYRHGKAPHSSYVCTGAETGKPGLFLFVAVLYCCLRTTITARTQTTDEERIRRLLFVLIISYIVSSWMVDFEYRPTFFMFTAAIAALHRHLLWRRGEQEEPAPAPDDSLEPPVPVWLHPPLVPQGAFAGAPGAMRESLLFPPENDEPETVVPAPQSSGIAWNWRRLGWVDLLLITVGWWGVIRFWAYMMERM